MTEGVRIALLRLRRKLLAGCEYLRYGRGRVDQWNRFAIVTCQRNAGAHAIRCLDSVYAQAYPRSLARHIFIDDASDDGTAEGVRAWLSAHPGHNVELIVNPTRLGGTCNTVRGIALADEDEIVAELNGDDWLPDTKVLDYLNRVYARKDIWMTYNSLRLSSGPPASWARPVPRAVVAANAFRDQDEWTTSHLHTFRKRLYDHLPADVMIDPETGTYWECADDQALYLGLFELAGRHSLHLNRITCIYNFWESSHSYADAGKSLATAGRIRQTRRCSPLDRL